MERQSVSLFGERQDAQQRDHCRLNLDHACVVGKLSRFDRGVLIGAGVENRTEHITSLSTATLGRNVHGFNTHLASAGPDDVPRSLSDGGIPHSVMQLFGNFSVSDETVATRKNVGTDPQEGVIFARDDDRAIIQTEMVDHRLRNGD